MAQPQQPTTDECDLGQLICARTPYTAMTMPANWKDLIEWDGKTVVWNFREVGRRVVKALRIPVTITYYNAQTHQNETYLDWLLIGYEGGSGD